MANYVAGKNAAPVSAPASAQDEPNQPKKPEKTASRKSRLSDENKPLEGAKLRVTESRGTGQQSWSVKGQSDAYFRVRVSDVGYRVGLVYKDDAGQRREPYLCYLSAQEWRSAKRGSLASFVGLVVAKMEQRGGEGGKVDALLNLVRGVN